MLEEAIKLAERGFRILPVSGPAMPGSSPGKRPLISKWQQDATTDPDQIRGWFARWPHANIGIATGRESGIFVLDVDPKHDGLTSLDALRKEIDLPPTLTVRTGSGGLHLYYRYPEGTLIKNMTSSLGAGLDIRGEGGQVVAPPSLHVSGKRYEWEV